MATPKTREVGFDADAAAKKRGEQNIVIGERQFHARKKTAEVMDEWIDVTPDTPPKKDEDAPQSKDEMKANIENVFKQVAVLIADDQGETPEVDFLRAELDIEEANAILERLSPPAPDREAAERGKQG